YVCNNQDCILKLKKSNGLSRGLKTNVPEEIYEECSNVR
ncbi:MAG: YlxR family protein, partial [Clostridia bacterium]|nr:YlxR family protein [Clostridia bacterium]